MPRAGVQYPITGCPAHHGAPIIAHVGYPLPLPPSHGVGECPDAITNDVNARAPAVRASAPRPDTSQFGKGLSWDQDGLPRRAIAPLPARRLTSFFLYYMRTT